MKNILTRKEAHSENDAKAQELYETFPPRSKQEFANWLYAGYDYNPKYALELLNRLIDRHNLLPLLASLGYSRHSRHVPPKAQFIIYLALCEEEQQNKAAEAAKQRTINLGGAAAGKGKGRKISLTIASTATPVAGKRRFGLPAGKDGKTPSARTTLLPGLSIYIASTHLAGLHSSLLTAKKKGIAPFLKQKGATPYSLCVAAKKSRYASSR